MSIILGLKLQDRQRYAPIFQEIISRFGCHIKTRIGLSQTESESCKNWGIILLEINEHQAAFDLEKELLKIDGIEIQRMIFPN